MSYRQDALRRLLIVTGLLLQLGLFLVLTLLDDLVDLRLLVGIEVGDVFLQLD